MITGYNTDIVFDGVTYHVQTEDKGLAKPMILSLVYDGGTILASKRLPYDDLLNGRFDEAELTARLQRQHRLICAAIQAGRIEDLRRMTLRESVAAAEAAKPTFVEADTNGDLKEPEVLEFEELFLPIPKPSLGGIEAPVTRPSIEPVLTGFVTMSPGEVVIPDDAVSVVSELVGRERPANNKLLIEFLGETRLKGGERKTITFMVCRGSGQKVVPMAEVMVKILGTTFRPLIFHATTDQNGLAKVNLQLPSFNSGRAAILARAMSDGEEVELRRTISHG